VHVTVRLFAGLRERAGAARLEIDGVERVDDVWAKLGLGDEPPGLLYALNRDYVGREHVLQEGDEVALIPPVSGGAFLLTGEPLDLGAAVAEATSDDAGAVATFVGTVRRSSRGRDVLYLEYEAFEEMAEPMLARLTRDTPSDGGWLYEPKAIDMDWAALRPELVREFQRGNMLNAPERRWRGPICRAPTCASPSSSTPTSAAPI